MDLGWVTGAFGMVWSAFLAVFVVAIGLWVVPMVLNGLLDMAGWNADKRVHYPDGWDWLGSPWYSIPFIGGLGVALGAMLSVARMVMGG